MGTMLATGSDVVSFLEQQHQDIKNLFERVRNASGEERTREFQALRRLLAVHETAEEEIVHPVARRVLADGEAIIDKRLSEENEAKKALAELESLDIDSNEFNLKFRKLNEDVLAHAESEEREEFARLSDALDQSKLERMRKAAALAEKFAPTRPHPGIESPVANILAGPFAAMVDRMRDALGKKA
jgi:hemerythrin superfamily protein